MLFAQEPTVPPDLKGSPALEFDTMPESYADTRVVDLLARAEVVKRQMIHAGCNLEVAQHRDQRRCQQHRPKCGLEAATKPAILKVVDIKDTGVVTLEDRTGLKEKTTPKLRKVPDGEWHGPCCEDKPEAARAERRSSEGDSTDVTVMERWAGKLKRATTALLEKTPSPTTVSESDVGPRRIILKGKAKQPWLAVSLARVQHQEERHWGAQKRADLGTEVCKAEGEIEEPQIRRRGSCNEQGSARVKRRGAEAEAIASQRSQFVGLGTGAGDDGAG
ncbi:hypothetical protein CYMTET_14708 [Cymbomonas tetramitiformis]|uniref:Uncharacterized protein n=1 Tax=Cymbomonas tetramitiformis TaxID=36881 RepID=A0AAE0GFT7_9CHLO|nr:hypothetical protein CYMTET_14708 [Cymbomonas tetramitiformis]